MPDPSTMAAAAAGKELAKKAEPYFGLLLKPSFELIGKELKSYLKERIDEWKKVRRQENLMRHIESARVVLEAEQATHPSKTTVEGAEAFEQWAEGVQDIDPDDNDLASIWQQLLVNIAQGKVTPMTLLEKLKAVTSSEAQVLLRFRKERNRYAKDDEERHLLKSLESKGIMRRTYFHIVRTVLIVAVFALLFSGFVSYAKQFSNRRFSYYQELKVEKGSHSYLSSEPDYYYYNNPDLILFDMLWHFSAMAIIILVTPYGFILYRRGFARWEPTWVGYRLIEYAKPRIA